MSYNTFLEVVQEFDIAFGKPAVDQCDTCTQFQHKLNHAKHTAEYEGIATEWNKHRIEGDASYDILAQDQAFSVLTFGEAVAKSIIPASVAFPAKHEMQTHALPTVHPVADVCEPMSVPASDMHIQDFWGNKTTPYLDVGEAYYRQKMNTYVFGINDARMGGQSIVYGYNPRVGHKGPNNVISAEYHYYRTYGVGAQAHVSHFDRCAGQSNNICCMKFHDLITNPNSGHQLFVQFDEKCAFTGHSYSAVDRNAGAAEKQHSHEKRPRMVVAEDWFDLICRCSRTKPFIVHRFDQKAHRRWVKKKGAREPWGLLDYFYRRTPPAGGWSGTRDGVRVTNIHPYQYRWRNYGAGVDDDGHWKKHPGVVWMRMQLTESNFDGVEPWTKVRAPNSSCILNTLQPSNLLTHECAAPSVRYAGLHGLKRQPAPGRAG